MNILMIENMNKYLYNTELAIGRIGMGAGTDPTDSTDLRDHSGWFSVGIFEMNGSTQD